MGVAEIDGLQIHYHAPRDPARAQGQRILYVHGTETVAEMESYEIDGPRSTMLSRSSASR